MIWGVEKVGKKGQKVGNGRGFFCHWVCRRYRFDYTGDLISQSRRNLGEISRVWVAFWGLVKTSIEIEIGGRLKRGSGQ